MLCVTGEEGAVRVHGAAMGDNVLCAVVCHRHAQQEAELAPKDDIMGRLILPLVYPSLQCSPAEPRVKSTTHESITHALKCKMTGGLWRLRDILM